MLIKLCYQLGANSFLSKNGNTEELRNFVQFFEHYSQVCGRMPETRRRRHAA